MFGVGPLELVVILIVALLVFGPKRVPELARTVGRGLAEFRRASSDLRQTLALDELKHDLQQNPSLKKPEDRPAQAGDSDSDEKPRAEDEERPDNAATEAATEAAAESNSSSDTNSNTAADSNLGNVPVSGSKPADPPRG